MGWRDGLVYIAFIVLLPPPLFWVIVHSAINFWRKFGTRTYHIFTCLGIIVPLGVYQFKSLLLAYWVERNLVTTSLGILCLLPDLLIWRATAKDLGVRALIGLPELIPDSFPIRLANQGIYTRVRHPIYLGYLLTGLGIFLITGAISVLILFLSLLILFYIVTALEEKELLNRFGKEYLEYQRRVPRLLPKILR